MKSSLNVVKAGWRFIIVGIVAMTIVGTIIFVSFATPEVDDKFPDKYTHYPYNVPFPVTYVIEDIDKSKEPRAWIVYDEYAPERSLMIIRKSPEEMKSSLPSYEIAKQSIDKHPALARVIAELSNEWISYETALSIVGSFRSTPYIAAEYGYCGQYRYIETYTLVFPTSTNELSFVTVVVPNLVRNCNYNPEEALYVQRPEIIGKIIEESFKFVQSNPLLVAVTGIGLIGVLIWRGSIKKMWFANGLSYNQFELMVRMRGSKTRLEILRMLDVPKTRQVIAQELNLDWKTVDRHIESLLRNNLIREICSLGRVSYYTKTENANTLLNIVENDKLIES